MKLPVILCACLAISAALTFATLAPDSASAAPATAPATAPTTAPALIDVGNTKCIVTGEDVTPGLTLTYEGKIYHLCCPMCKDDFAKDPAKYLKALHDNPAKYGLPKQ